MVFSKKRLKLRPFGRTFSRISAGRILGSGRNGDRLPESASTISRQGVSLATPRRAAMWWGAGTMRVAQRQVRGVMADRSTGPERDDRRHRPRVSMRVMEAMLKMDKIDIPTLEQAYA